MAKYVDNIFSVREKIYILLGVIAEVYPEYMTQYADRLTGIYLGALKAEVGLMDILFE